MNERLLGADRFGDVDVAVSVDRGSPPAPDPTTYELDLEAVLERGLGLPVDVRVVEDAPPSFRYAVTRGEELFVLRAWCLGGAWCLGVGAGSRCTPPQRQTGGVTGEPLSAA